MGSNNFSIYSNCKVCGQYKKVRRIQNDCYRCYQGDLRKRNEEAVVSIRIPMEQHEELKRKSLKTNVPMSELLRTYFCWGLENDI